MNAFVPHSTSMNLSDSEAPKSLPDRIFQTSMRLPDQLLLDFTAQQVARVCQTLDDSNSLERLTRFLWSLPDDQASREAFDRHESVLLARAVVAYHSGQFNELYRLLSSHRYHKLDLT